MNKYLITALLIGTTLQVGSSCPEGYSSEINGCLPQCVMSKDGGTPDLAGPEPQVTWAPPRIPIGLADLVIEGIKFAGDNLTVSIKPMNGSVIPTTLVTPPMSITTDTTQITVKPEPTSWGNLTTGGPASLIVTNANGTSEYLVTLVKLAFLGGPTAPVAFTNTTMSRWIQVGKYGTSDVVYRSHDNGMEYIGYQPSNGTFSGSPVTAYKPASLTATADVDGDATADFFAMNNGSMTPVLVLYKNADGLNPLSGTMQPWGTTPLTALAAGPASKTSILIATADNTGKAYSCLYTKSPEAATCQEITDRLSEAAKGLWVQDFGTGSADILALGASTGKLTLLRGNAAAGFKNATPAELTSQTGWNALAVADLDGNGKADLVGVTANAVVVLLNDGQKFSASSIAIPAAAVAVTARDLDKSGRPDIMITDSSGKLSALLNQGDGGKGNGRFVGPVDLKVDAGPGGLLAFDDQTRGLITLSQPAQQLKSWENKTTP